MQLIMELCSRPCVHVLLQCAGGSTPPPPPHPTQPSIHHQPHNHPQPHLCWRTACPQWRRCLGTCWTTRMTKSSERWACRQRDLWKSTRLRCAATKQPLLQETPVHSSPPPPHTPHTHTHVRNTRRPQQVKIASKTYQNNIANVTHADELMLQAGWRPQVRLVLLGGEGWGRGGLGEGGGSAFS